MKPASTLIEGDNKSIPDQKRRTGSPFSGLKSFCHLAVLTLASLPAAESQTDVAGAGPRGTSDISLEQAFTSPPASAQCFTHWYWHVPANKENITQDLEAMRQQGIKGARVFPFGAYMTPEWLPLFGHMLEEAKRLNLQIQLNNDRGWSCKFLPWMTDELAAKKVVYSEKTVEGGRRIVTPLAVPEINDDYYKTAVAKLNGRAAVKRSEVNQYYRDIAVVACRVPPGSAVEHSAASGAALRSKTGAAIPSSYPAGGLDFYYQAAPPASGAAFPQASEVLDVSARMDSSGQLDWEAPAGAWKIYRFGYTVQAPDRPDPFIRESLDLHLRESVEKLLPLAGGHVGTTWTHMHFDSWENGCQTWTPEFRREFLARRGYDMTPWLPALAGRILGSPSLNDRFLHDYRLTISDLMVENHFRHWERRLHDMGLQFTSQGGYGWGSAIVDGLKVFGAIDLPQGEFWSMQRHPVTGQIQERQFKIHKLDQQAEHAERALTFGLGLNCVRLAAAATHTYGKPYCSAESFISYIDIMGSGGLLPDPGKDFGEGYNLCDSPFSIKAAGDRAFCDGLQHVGYEVYSLQPAGRDRSLHAWNGVGLHFNRNITWWKQGRAFSEYLARCAAVFQQGKFVADFAYWTGDVMPYECPDRVAMRPALPRGCNADLVNTDVLLNRLTVKEGRFWLPDGISYRYLVMPPTQKTVNPASLRRIRDLVAAGATVVLGPKPVSAIGLSNYPACDAEVKALADEIWGRGEPRGAGSRALGQGRVVWGWSLAELLKADALPQDLEVEGEGRMEQFDWIHYRAGDREIYFVSNQADAEQAVNVRFRVGGKQPELWDPVWGTRRRLPEYHAAQGVTVVPMRFAPRESCFVVFAPKSDVPDVFAGRNFPGANEVLNLGGDWRVNFELRNGGPGEVRFAGLEDWTKRNEDGIKHYSGTATYRKSFDLPASVRAGTGPLYLALGVVKDLAEVRLNGKELGVVWCAPWQVDIEGAVKPRGNVLEIDVVNQWPNRLIGDSALPETKRLVKTNFKMRPEQPLVSSGLLGPVTLQIVEGTR